MTLGYIVSSRKIKGLNAFVECVNDISLADTSKPVLIVGINKAKEYGKDNFSILKKEIAENVYWTYNKTEKRDIFEKDIENFQKLIIFNIINNINYYYVNIIKLNYTRIKNLYNILFSSNKNYIYINKDMIYINYNSNNVLGISLKILEYCGIKKEKIIDKIKSFENNVFYNSDFKWISLLKYIDNKKYAIPYFISIEQ